ncbi:hypothetical protein BBP40_006695 [Aspergillus hancockii]|nr:hypothetical protein BBP40_006695 [Aspergillus hancockii]
MAADSPSHDCDSAASEGEDWLRDYRQLEHEEKKTKTQLIVARAMSAEYSRKVTETIKHIDQLEEILKSLRDRRGSLLPHSNCSVSQQQATDTLPGTEVEQTKVHLAHCLQQATELIVGSDGPTLSQLKRDPQFWLNLDVFHGEDE